jgi:hypothetical protein
MNIKTMDAPTLSNIINFISKLTYDTIQICVWGVLTGSLYALAGIALVGSGYSMVSSATLNIINYKLVFAASGISDGLCRFFDSSILLFFSFTTGIFGILPLTKTQEIIKKASLNYCHLKLCLNQYKLKSTYIPQHKIARAQPYYLPASHIKTYQVEKNK